MSMCDSLTSRREKASLPSPWWVQLPVMEPMVKLGAILQLTLLWNGDSPLNTIRNLKFSHENKTRKITGFHLNTSYGIGCRGYFLSSYLSCACTQNKNWPYIYYISITVQKKTRHVLDKIQILKNESRTWAARGSTPWGRPLPLARAAKLLEATLPKIFRFI